MIIRSRFKDYYDFVATQYGGGDPKILYIRDRLTVLERRTGPLVTGLSEGWKEVEIDHGLEADPELPWQTVRDQRDTSINLTSRTLVIAGKAYLMIRFGSPLVHAWDLTGFAVCRPEEIEKKVKLRYQWSMNRWVKDVQAWWGKESTQLIELCREVQAPVFVIESIQRGYRQGAKIINRRVRIHGQCPILKDLGVPALIPPTQINQDLAYFMGNTMYESPDISPPVEVGNDSKIINAGFDLRWSFRHRIGQEKV